MKKWNYILLAFLLCALCVACVKVRVLSVHMLKAEAERAMLKGYHGEFFFDESYVFWDDEASGWSGHFRYYGIYKDAVVFGTNQGEELKTELSVAGEQFECGGGFSIYVYHEGEIQTLEEAYGQGLLTQREIGKIAQKHKEYLIQE